MKAPVQREWATILILLLLLVAVATRFDWFHRLDKQAYDWSMALWARPAILEVVIVGVDEASLQQIGRWPWRRAIQASIVDKISQAKPATIGLDVIYTEPDKVDANADALLAKAIARSGNVVLPVIPRVEEGAIYGEALPVSPIREAGVALAMIKSHTDADGVMRATYLRGGAGAAKYRLLGWEAMIVSGLFPGAIKASTLIESAPETDVKFAVPSASTWVSQSPFRIPYAGPPGHFTVIPAINILRGDVPDNALKGKIVLFGVTATGLGDEYPTPVSGQTRAMPGVEIHANVIQALAEGINLQVVGRIESAFFASALLLLVMGGYLRLSPRNSLLLVSSVMVFVVLFTLVVFRLAALWISPTLALIALAMSYPLWSWRKLEATQRYFDQELMRLADEPDVVPTSTLTLAPSINTRQSRLIDVFALRIDAITAATERLRSLKRFVADSIESLPIAAFVVDFNDKIMLSNTAADRLFHHDSALPPPALEGLQLAHVLAQLRPSEAMTWDEISAELHQTLRADNMRNALIIIEPITVEAKSIPPANDRDCVVQFAPLYSHTGVATGLIVTIADITPLRESERRRDEALRFLSHDMRSPQASIITLIDMARENPDSIARETLLERIGKYSRRTLNLADDFLRLAKAERAKPADFQHLELTEVLQDVVEEAEATAHAKLIRVAANIAVDEAWVMGDRDLLTRAVINLVSNAIKYSPDKTTVSISLIQADASWKIAVTDEGVGISPANMNLLFKRFQRLHQEGQPKADGIGLGLVFVKTVIERMGGEVNVESKVAAKEGDSHGTTFSITLVAIDPDA
jgi:CHASE2 domain-containing sensor protein/nitrogen-specific signal transduction histidine kinase